VIDVKNLSKSFGKHLVLDDISEHISPGEKVVIIGPSGSGKSTFLRCLNLLETPTGGTITFQGQEITGPKVDIDKVREQMGMVFQHFNLFPHMTILENMTLAPVKLLRKSREEAEAKARALLERVGLGDRADAYPSQLSGGQQQRVALARTLAQNPKIILADEPVAALDPVTAKQVMQDFVRINKDLGISILLNIHHVELAIEYADRIIGIRAGQIVYDGPAKAVDQTVLNSIYGESGPQEETA